SLKESGASPHGPPALRQYCCRQREKQIARVQEACAEGGGRLLRFAPAVGRLGGRRVGARGNLGCIVGQRWHAGGVSLQTRQLRGIFRLVAVYVVDRDAIDFLPQQEVDDGVSRPEVAHAVG